VKAVCASDIHTVEIESTSPFGGYSGRVDELPDGNYTFVGPDPYRSRKFYGVIKVDAGKVTVS